MVDEQDEEQSENERDGANRPGRPPGHHRAHETDANGKRIWTSWEDCTCSIGGDHDK